MESSMMLRLVAIACASTAWAPWGRGVERVGGCWWVGLAHC